MNPTPPPFGDPSRVREENQRAIGKGIGIGCGSCLLLVIAAVVLFATLFFIVIYALNSSDAADEAVKRATATPEVKAALGEPLTRGWITTGNSNQDGNRRTASLTVPLVGPKASGSLHLEGHAEGSRQWEFSVIRVDVDGTHQSIDLLSAEKPPTTAQ